MSKRFINTKTPLERTIEAITKGVGSPVSLVIHTILFIGCFSLVLFEVAAFETVLLVLTTLVSLEAIYLALFIQMTVNRASESLEAVEEDIDEIQEDIAGIEKDVDEIQEDVAEIEKDIDVIEKDLDEIEEDSDEQDKRDAADAVTLQKIEANMAAILADLEKLRK